VAEFGLVGATMHKTDECVPIAELRDLARIYRVILAAFLA
jgi:succinyl-diaminopimelate desuccinylase